MTFIIKFSVKVIQFSMNQMNGYKLNFWYTQKNLNPIFDSNFVNRSSKYEIQHDLTQAHSIY